VVPIVIPMISSAGNKASIANATTDVGHIKQIQIGSGYFFASGKNTLLLWFLHSFMGLQES
jgi:hypothetical protein